VLLLVVEVMVLSNNRVRAEHTDKTRTDSESIQHENGFSEKKKKFYRLAAHGVVAC